MQPLYQRLLLFILLSFGLTQCSQTNQDPSQDVKPTIVATTSIVADIANNLCADFANVTSLMGPGVDPHLYKASHGDVESLSKADVILYNGLHLEGKMSNILNKLKNEKTVLAVSDGIQSESIRSINVEASVHDPHVWFDITLWSQGVKYISQQLQKEFPAHSEMIAKNTFQYLSDMDSVHQLCLKLVDQLPAEKRVLITSHDAFEYFGRSYSFEVKGLQGISTLSESGLKDVTDMVNFIIDRKIKAVFVENSVPQKALRSVIDGCVSKGHTVTVGGEIFSDALGAERTPEGSYIGMIHYNVETIVNALK